MYVKYICLKYPVIIQYSIIDPTRQAIGTETADFFCPNTPWGQYTTVYT